MSDRCYLEDTVFDENGDVVVGAKVYFFASGTGVTHTEPTVPTGTAVTGSFYAANSGGSALTNPLTTDSEGHWEAYFATAQRVDVIISSNNGAATINGLPSTFVQRGPLPRDVFLAPSSSAPVSTASTAGFDYILTWDGTYASGINGRTGATDYGGAGSAGGATGTLFDSVWNTTVALLAQRGPTNQASSAGTLTASQVGNDATYVAADRLPQPGHYVTVTGMSVSGYNTTGRVKSVSIGGNSFVITLTTSGLGAGTGGTFYQLSPGGKILIQNTQANNAPIPVKATLQFCDYLSVEGQGLGEINDTTTASAGNIMGPWGGSCVLQATATFTGDANLTAADQKCVVNMRGGGSQARTGSGSGSLAGLQGTTLANLMIDCNNVADKGAIVLAKGTGHSGSMRNVRIIGGVVNNLQFGGSGDSGGSTDFTLQNVTVGSLGSSAAAGAGAVEMYTGDITLDAFCNFTPSGDVHPLIIRNGLTTRVIGGCHIGGSGNRRSNIKVIGGQNIVLEDLYLDNISSNVKARAGMVIEQATASLFALTIRNCHFNMNGSGAPIMFDFTNGGTTIDSVTIEGNRIIGNQETSGGIDFNTPCLVAVVGGTINNKHMVIRNNKGKSVGSVILGSVSADANYIETAGNTFAPSSGSSRGGGKIGTVNTTINASTTSLIVDETVTPIYSTYGTEATSPIFIPFSTVIGTEKCGVTNRVVVSGSQYTYTIVRGIEGTTAASHTAGVDVSVPMALDGSQEQYGSAVLAAGTKTVTHSLWGTPAIFPSHTGALVGNLKSVGVGTIVAPVYVTAFAQGTFVLASSDSSDTATVFWYARCNP